MVQLSRETLGATETVILALESFGDAVFDVSGSSLLLLDCDAIYHCDIISKFRELEIRQDVRAAVLCFEESVDDRAAIAKYSYVMASDGDGRVTAIAEKSRGTICKHWSVLVCKCRGVLRVCKRRRG